MRNFLLILLNVLCLTTAFSQAVQTAKRQYTRISPADPFKVINQVLKTYDKKICKDTLITEEYYNADITGQYKNVVTTNKKYDSQNRLIESVVARTNYSKGLVATDTFKAYRATTDRSRYVYTAANVRADTIKTDSYDATTKTWSTPYANLIRKAGFGFDTVKTANVYIVYDNKGRIIIDKYMSDGKNTSDSVFLKFDAADNLVALEKFSNNYGTTKLLRYYQLTNTFLNGNLTKQNLVVTLTDTLITTTDFYFKNNLPDYEETLTKNIKKSVTNVITVDSSKTRLRYVSFNTANKCLEKVNEQLSNTTKVWSYIGGSKMVYQSDTLLLRDTLTANGQQTLSVYEYGTCSQVVSDIHDTAKAFDFTVAPNPANGLITVSLGDENAQTETQLTIYNIQGIVVQSRKMNSPSASLDVSNLSRGLYFIKLGQQNQFSTKKIILN